MAIVVEGLGEVLHEDDRQVLARALPETVRSALLRSMPGQNFSVDEFFHRVSEREGIPEGFGREHAQVVCWELRRLLSEKMLAFLIKRLPNDIADLFDESHTPSPGYHAPHRPVAPAPGGGHKLSDGRPGSTHPLSEAHESHNERPAHRDSVARSDNPHGDRKVSSGAGPNEGHDLSSGKSSSS